MLPIEIIIPSLVLNLVYILLKVLEQKDKFKHIVGKLTNSKNKLENSLKEYNNSLQLTEIKNNVDDDVAEFIETLTELTDIIKFTTV
jgi:hypothetical protein